MRGKRLTCEHDSQNACDPCRKVHNYQYWRNYRLKHQELRNEQEKARYHQQLEKSRERTRSRRYKHPEKFREKQHGMRFGDKKIANMLAAQEQQCAICFCDISKKFAIDHDHEIVSGPNVRGALCCRCNSGLGQFRDDPALLRQAITYLHRYDTEHKLQQLS